MDKVNIKKKVTEMKKDNYLYYYFSKSKLFKQTICNNFLKCWSLLVILLPAPLHEVHKIRRNIITAKIRSSSPNNIFFKNYKKKK